MIPKIIHYCWFGGAPKSPFIKKCMQTWKERLPDYEWKEWNENTFDINSIPFVREAYKEKKWAFVADYVRLYALYTEGGIYMDTDVKVIKPFDEFLKYNFFSSHEKYDFFYDEEEQNKLDKNKRLKNGFKYIEGFGVLSAIMGSVPSLPYLKDCLSYYKNLEFNLDKKHINNYIIGKHLSYIMSKYGYRFDDVTQHLKDEMIIFPSDVFVGNMQFLNKNSYAIHLCNGSWTENANSFNNRIRNQYPTISPIYFFFVKIWKKLFH